MAISAADVKKLKDMTNAGMMDCKRALEETNGNFDSALKILKEKGLADAKKRSDRETKEGGVFVKISGNKVGLILLGCETDFVSGNEVFKSQKDKILEKLISSGNDNPAEYQSFVEEITTQTKEHIELKVVKYLETKNNEIATSYIHGNNKIGVVAIFETNKPELKDNAEFKEMAANVAMHIAALNPFYLSEKDVNEKELAEQKEILLKQMGDTKKPANILENIIKGKMQKYLGEICLLDQPYVKDDKQSVKEYVDSVAKKLGAEIKIAKYLRHSIGA
jgi:elongation factor Ts